MNNMHELPSGRLINLENIIYIGDIKTTEDIFGSFKYYFTIVWAGGEKMNLMFDDEKSCELELNDIKNIFTKHTETLICD